MLANILRRKTTVGTLPQINETKARHHHSPSQKKPSLALVRASADLPLQDGGIYGSHRQKTEGFSPQLLYRPTNRKVEMIEPIAE
jgi:hypothetical protein